MNFEVPEIHWAYKKVQSQACHYLWARDNELYNEMVMLHSRSQIEQAW